jgi:hypothetical protein
LGTVVISAGAGFQERYARNRVELRLAPELSEARLSETPKEKSRTDDVTGS